MREPTAVAMRVKGREFDILYLETEEGWMECNGRGEPVRATPSELVKEEDGRGGFWWVDTTYPLPVEQSQEIPRTQTGRPRRQSTSASTRPPPPKSTPIASASTSSKRRASISSASPKRPRTEPSKPQADVKGKGKARANSRGARGRSRGVSEASSSSTTSSRPLPKAEIETSPVSGAFLSTFEREQESPEPLPHLSEEDPLALSSSPGQVASLAAASSSSSTLPPTTSRRRVSISTGTSSNPSRSRRLSRESQLSPRLALAFDQMKPLPPVFSPPSIEPRSGAGDDAVSHLEPASQLEPALSDERSTDARSRSSSASSLSDEPARSPSPATIIFDKLQTIRASLERSSPPPQIPSQPFSDSPLSSLPSSPRVRSEAEDAVAGAEEKLDEVTQEEAAGSPELDGREEIASTIGQALSSPHSSPQVEGEGQDTTGPSDGASSSVQPLAATVDAASPTGSTEQATAATGLDADRKDEERSAEVALEETRVVRGGSEGEDGLKPSHRVEEHDEGLRVDRVNDGTETAQSNAGEEVAQIAVKEQESTISKPPRPPNPFARTPSAEAVSTKITSQSLIPTATSSNTAEKLQDGQQRTRARAPQATSLPALVSDQRAATASSSPVTISEDPTALSERLRLRLPNPFARTPSATTSVSPLDSSAALPSASGPAPKHLIDEGSKEHASPQVSVTPGGAFPSLSTVMRASSPPRGDLELVNARQQVQPTKRSNFALLDPDTPDGGLPASNQEALEAVFAAGITPSPFQSSRASTSSLPPAFAPSTQPSDSPPPLSAKPPPSSVAQKPLPLPSFTKKSKPASAHVESLKRKLPLAFGAQSETTVDPSTSVRESQTTEQEASQDVQPAQRGMEPSKSSPAVAEKPFAQPEVGSSERISEEKRKSEAAEKDEVEKGPSVGPSTSTPDRKRARTSTEGEDDHGSTRTLAKIVIKRKDRRASPSSSKKEDTRDHVAAKEEEPSIAAEKSGSLLLEHESSPATSRKHRARRIVESDSEPDWSQEDAKASMSKRFKPTHPPPSAVKVDRSGASESLDVTPTVTLDTKQKGQEDAKLLSRPSPRVASPAPVKPRHPLPEEQLKRQSTPGITKRSASPAFKAEAKQPSASPVAKGKGKEREVQSPSTTGAVAPPKKSSGGTQSSTKSGTSTPTGSKPRPKSSMNLNALLAGGGVKTSVSSLSPSTSPSEGADVDTHAT